MLKTFAVTTAASALMISGALAQTTTTPAPSAAPPAKMEKMDNAKPHDSATMSKDSSAMASTPKFISAQGSDQWVTSKFKGTDVLGPNNEHIGDVSDILFTKDGQIIAYVVGVGGFLGIGEKNVAIDPTAFQAVPADNNSTDPNDIKLKTSWTKDQLKSAPSFEYYKAPARTTGAAPATNTGMAPRPAAPAR